MGGSSKTTTSKTKYTPAPPSPQELKLKQQQIALGEKQAAAIEKANQFTQEFLVQQALTELSLLQQGGEINASTGQLVQNDLATLLQNSPTLSAIITSQTQFAADAAARPLEMRDIENSLLNTQVENSESLTGPSANEQLLAELANATASLGPSGSQVSTANNILLENLQNANRNPDEIKADLQAAADLQIEGGLADIETFSRRLGTQLRTQVAPQRGLRPGDSPILDRAGEIQLAGVEQGAQLIRDVRGAQIRAQADVEGTVQERVGNLGGQITNSAVSANSAAGGIASAGTDTELKRSELVGSTAGDVSNRIAAENQFQQTLADAAANNRLALTGSFNNNNANATQAATSLATGVNPNIAGAIGAEMSFRAGTADSSTTSTEKTSGGGLGSILGGAGGLLSGIAAVSSHTYKTDKEPVTILDKLSSVPVEKWRYNWDDGVMHIGPYAEDFNNAFGIGQENPKVIQIIDYLGVILGGLKELNDKFDGSVAHA